MKENFNRVKGSTASYVPGPCNCSPKKEPTDCDPGKYSDSLLCDQVNVSRCEAELFCKAVEKLICGLEQARTPCELKQVFELAGTLLTSSAAKELSLAGMIRASAVTRQKANRNCGCDC